MVCLWEIEGRFRKRVVLANVPSFRFSFQGNIRRNHPFGNHPFVSTKKGHWETKGRFPKGWFWRTYLVPVFVPGEHPPKPPFWKPRFCEPPTDMVCLADIPANKPDFFRGLHKGLAANRATTNTNKIHSPRNVSPFWYLGHSPKLHRACWQWLFCVSHVPPNGTFCEH